MFMFLDEKEAKRLLYFHSCVCEEFWEPTEKLHSKSVSRCAMKMWLWSPRLLARPQVDPEEIFTYQL